MAADLPGFESAVLGDKNSGLAASLRRDRPLQADEQPVMRPPEEPVFLPSYSHFLRIKAARVTRGPPGNTDLFVLIPSGVLISGRTINRCTPCCFPAIITTSDPASAAPMAALR
jgi:hypothetical protein